MIVYRVAVRVRAEKLNVAREMFARLATESRKVPGVIHFDILQDPADPHSFVSSEVYEDQAAIDRQERLPELDEVMRAFPEILVGCPDGTKFFVSSAEPWPAASLG
ncbi:antibiotic biosynthesis monooxygenase [Microbispora cellulosiformans]|uniref:Antibiotic biosynthesis monooxygenase n=1 Tax=Microbispora cellulosiformans TaxID=2614688 RepID=A0A5J5JX45_9ACTN|nr:putative quinol monooxygenase [Microbispora cellulosiformans]KAA9375533.1 antibiotic biosynthesis monooxygenase [Microbispora cellulosiformans]